MVHSDKYGSQIKEVAAPESEQSQPGSGEAKPMNLIESRQNRILNRCNYVQSQRKTKI